MNGRATGEAVSFPGSDGAVLSGYLARPSFSAASGAGRHGVVLAHGLPEPNQKPGSPSNGFTHLATRLAAETGANVLTFDFRGTGASQGDISLQGWRGDLSRAIRLMRDTPGVERLWLVGFAAGGTLCLGAAGEDTSLAGVATFAAPSELADASTDPRRPRDLQLLHSVANIPPRPLLIVHGASDEVVPLADARALADATDGSAELRIVGGAGHMLLHDPRAVALLLGWFDRHLGAPSG